MDKEQNICFNTDDGQRFRYRAAAVIIEDGCVLMATNSVANYYYTVGGGVHLGETAEQCVEREVWEETGVRYKVDRLLFVYENFFTDNAPTKIHGLRCHEITLLFLMKSRGTKQLPAHKSICVDGEEHLAWLPINKYSEYNAFPRFFATELDPLPDSIKHIVVFG